MANSFLFIIPLTPSSHLTKTRQELQQLCFKSLLNQKYKNWKAIIIGESMPENANDPRFIHIKFEDIKEVKLQKATTFIIENNIKSEYIIRLDDDDIISDIILEHYKDCKSDIITDLNHWYIDWTSKLTANEFKPWFPNSCIHKSENALAQYGRLAQDYIQQINNNVLLIENNHAEAHHYYRGKTIEFTKKNSPIYLRVLHPESITSLADKEYSTYLKKMGDWTNKTPDGFSLIFTNSLSKRTSHTKFSLRKSIINIIRKAQFIRYLKK
ncbi:MAG: hypothetical protein N4A35_07395 [Flavobacteriales bacterium]|jgi:hypothetical protein|nr:hypothetical protein [Flavobacteriales bacterium]